MLEHMFISETDGALHDTRDENWSARPLRINYCRTHRYIKSCADFKATIRAGEFAWPGGYQMFLITSDGGALSFASAKENAGQVLDSIGSGSNDGWRVVGCDINYEDTDLYCDHSGESIPAAYC